VLLDDSGSQTGRTFDLGSDPFFGYLVNGHLDPIRGRIGLQLDPAAPVTLQAGNLDDSFQVHDLVGIPTLSIDGGGGNNTLNINDQGTSSQQEYILNATQLLRYPIPLSANPTATINYFNVSSLNVHGSSAFDTWIVRSTLKGTTTALYSDTPAGTTGANAFLVGDSNNPLDGIQGPLALHGASVYDYVEDYDYLNPSPHTYTLSTPNPTTTLLQRDGIAPITQDGIGELILYVPVVGGNHLNVQGVPANLLATLSASNGDQDVVGSLAPTSQGGTMSAILGEVGIGFEANTVTAPVTLTLDDSGDNTTAPRRVTMGSHAINPSITVPLITNLAGNGEEVYWRDLPSGSSVTVHGRAGGNETFAMQSLPSTQVPPTINAGGSNNTLDYSAFTGDIKVNLRLGTATELAGISGIQNVTGSIGNNLIVGDASPHVFIGGTLRNVIISGAGGGTLDASRATSDNLLIGGYTDFDTDPLALDAIFNEWTRPLLSFKQRFNDLTTGSSGALNRVNGKLILLTSTTVHANTAADKLIGSNQTDPATGARVHNWFFDDRDSDDMLLNFLMKSSDHETLIK
jgi:hypothetical protein